MGFLIRETFRCLYSHRFRSSITNNTAMISITNPRTTLASRLLLKDNVHSLFLQFPWELQSTSLLLVSQRNNLFFDMDWCLIWMRLWTSGPWDESIYPAHHVCCLPSQYAPSAVWTDSQKVSKRYFLSHQRKYPSQPFFLYGLCHIYYHPLRVSQEGARCMCTLPSILDFLGFLYIVIGSRSSFTCRS